MNIGVYICGLLAVFFGIIGILFAIFKGRAAGYVSGFNYFSREEQEKYDRELISRDLRNQCFLWGAVMAAGAVLSYVINSYMAIPAFLVWLVLFFMEVHIDNHKAFEKYLKK